MSNKVLSETVVSEFREFVKDQLEPLFHFCYFLSGWSSEGIDTLVVATFRELGRQYRKRTRKNSSPWEVLEARISLFQIAWNKIQNAKDFSMDTVFTSVSPIRLHSDLLSNFKEEGVLTSEYLERFSRIDLDLRGLLILRDILNFDEEEIVRILDLRWATYRHRLHRGRLEFKNQLKGRESGLRPPEFHISQEARPTDSKQLRPE